MAFTLKQNNSLFCVEPVEDDLKICFASKYLANGHVLFISSRIQQSAVFAFQLMQSTLGFLFIIQIVILKADFFSSILVSIFSWQFLVVIMIPICTQVVDNYASNKFNFQLK
ncbi:hypothetical protein T11_5985 [Trichinella zimbabwensis]|uniref:Uncharacterized protein n=1 Tax=Trichinella zimbabwensis TaxID=268475 RepID=A0A0V1HY89_9BILA|nr:hypothetical protein T11_5985 [Trichinella zimbabwensis]